MEEQIVYNKAYAVEEVRKMAVQFADLYFEFVNGLRESLGEEEALKLTQQVLFRRAAERAMVMVKRAESEGVPRTWENINRMTDVPLVGWDASLGAESCPYGVAWNRRIKEHPWFRRFARLYCDVTDTTIAEVFTGDHSHKLYKNVVLGDSSCERTYFPSDEVKNGKLSHGSLNG